MNVDLIESLSQILLVVHTLVLYPVIKYVFLIEKRFTKLETKLGLENK